MAGETFAGFTLTGLLGQGGMGSVYLAQHPRLERRIALKLLDTELASDHELRRRFEQEANAIARLDHPGIVGIHDRGVHDGHLWIAMQYVEGVDASRVDPRTMTVQRAVRIVADTASALDYAHSQGVLHRDVKPANILLSAAHTGRDERAILTDFGIARLIDSNTQLTATGLVTATMAYASPEQLSAERVDHRSDQYSLACTLFAILTGRPPYDSTNAGQVVAGHLSKPFPALSHLRADVPVALDHVLARAGAKNPADRFASCSEFAAAASAALTGRTPVAARLAPTAVAHPNVPNQLGAAHNSPGRLRPAALAAAALSAVAGLFAIAAGLRLWVLYSGMKMQVRKLDGYAEGDFPLTYFGVGTLVAATVALLLFGGAGFLLADRLAGRVSVVLGTLSYAVAVVLGLTADPVAYNKFDLTLETAICVVGLLFAIAAAICALHPSAVTRTGPRLPRLAIAAGISSLLCAVIAGFCTWRLSMGYPYEVAWTVVSGIACLTLLVGGYLLFGRVSVARAAITVGAVCMSVLSAVLLSTVVLSLFDLYRYVPLHRYAPWAFGSGESIIVGVTASLFSMLALTGVRSKSTVAALNNVRSSGQ
ncbi:serine/threonine-protein kinase [Nocardia caishijiensis]|uniref:non-specific serine/threonine protein kinase n=1 Tax=Nocardia caishijiensis TaxID=184756 RepID=A0ABQ6YLA7_9NOCA|nr:serine/threonine-protein kinase [Nocardia caishijiensis]KAF0846579.1 serine/threonine-protein kinase [Nocardia caishijiensis]